MACTSLNALIAALPKAELHVHLEGTLEPEMLFSLAAKNHVELPYATIEEVRAAYDFSNLQDFLDIYYAGTTVLKTEQDFRDLALAYFRRASEDNIKHVEAFFDPQAHTERGVPVSVVMNGLLAAIDDAKGMGISVFLIPNFLRHLPESAAIRTFKELEPFLDQIVGIGLDSSEVGHPPELFQGVFSMARSEGLKLVTHAGEEGPPDYVWQALQLLSVNRIDHGNRALEDADLVQFLRAQRIPLTVCPLSNLKLAVVDDLTNHPLKEMLRMDLVATVNSDDPAYFGGYMNENFRQVSSALNLSGWDISQLVCNSFAASFLPVEIRKSFVNEVRSVTESHLNNSADT